MSSPRLMYQKQFAEGRVVNIGCGDVPVDFGPDTVQVDMDLYNYPNFVQADAHNLPFKDDEFDTAVLGDMLEHCPDPAQVLREAGRVAKKVVATVFEEWRHDDMTIEERVKAGYAELKKLGHETIADQYKSLPVFKDRCIGIVEDHEIPHHFHIQNFTDDDITKIVEDSGLDLIIRKKFHEGTHEGHDFFNWLLVLKKKGE